MNIREGALIVFTLLMQASVGLLLAIVVLQATGAKSAPPGRPTAFAIPIGVALAAAVAGMLASLLHLGRPFQAWLAVNNLAASWLSREIAIAVVFVVVTAAYAILAARDPLGGPARLTAWLAAVAGCCVIAAMSRLYMVPAQPAWNRVLTPVGFFTTSLLLGVAILVALGSARSGFSLAPSVQRTVAYVAIGLIVLQLCVLLAHVAALPADPAAALPGATSRWAQGAVLVTLVAGVAALAILVRGVRQSPYASMVFSPAGAGVLLALVGIVAIAGRALFYAAAVDLRGAAGPPL